MENIMLIGQKLPFNNRWMTLRLYPTSRLWNPFNHHLFQRSRWRLFLISLIAKAKYSRQLHCKAWSGDRHLSELTGQRSDKNWT